MSQCNAAGTQRYRRNAMPIAHISADVQRSTDSSKLQDWMSKMRPANQPGIPKHQRVDFKRNSHMRRSLENGVLVAAEVKGTKKLPPVSGWFRKHDEMHRVAAISKDHNPLDEIVYGGKPRKEDTRQEIDTFRSSFDSP